MAQFHISGRPRPLRVNALVDPGEPAAAPVSGTNRSMRSTVMMTLPAERNHPPMLWPAAAALGIVMIALVLWFHPGAAPSTEAPAVAHLPRAAKPSLIPAGTKPVVTDETWTYGRVGNPPHQTLPSQAALAAYRNELEKMADKQKQVAQAVP